MFLCHQLYQDITICLAVNIPYISSDVRDGNYIILDGIEGCMRKYCTRHDDIHQAGTVRWISSWLVQYILIQPEIKPSNIIIITCI